MGPREVSLSPVQGGSRRHRFCYLIRLKLSKSLLWVFVSHSHWMHSLGWGNCLWFFTAVMYLCYVHWHSLPSEILMIYDAIYTAFKDSDRLTIPLELLCTEEIRISVCKTDWSGRLTWTQGVQSIQSSIVLCLYGHLSEYSFTVLFHNCYYKLFIPTGQVTKVTWPHKSHDLNNKQ